MKNTLNLFAKTKRTFVIPLVFLFLPIPLLLIFFCSTSVHSHGLSCYCKFLSLSPTLLRLALSFAAKPIVSYFWHRVEILPDVLQPAAGTKSRRRRRERKKKTIYNTRFDPFGGPQCNPKMNIRGKVPVPCVQINK